MICTLQSPSLADPASHRPSEARTAHCTCCGGTRQPDPTDDFIVMLKEYAELGMRLARATVAGAEEAVSRLAPAEPAIAAASEAADPEAGKREAKRRDGLKSADLAYYRAGRSIRLCMSLAIKFHTDRLEREKQIAAAEAGIERQRKERRKGQLQRLASEAIRHHTEREIERQIEAEEIFEVDEVAEEDTLNGLREALSERLDEEDIERDLDICPTSELLGRLCQDLGIEPDWQRLGRMFWALEEIQRNAPGSRFTAAPKAESEPPPEPEPAEPVPQAAEPDEIEPDEARPPEPEPDVPRSEVPPPPIILGRNGVRLPTLEEQRAHEEHAARMRARFYNGL